MRLARPGPHVCPSSGVCVPCRVRETWQRSDRTSHPKTGKEILCGTEVQIRGLQGRWVFVAHVTAPAGEWIECLDTRAAHSGSPRSFRPDRITRIYKKQ